MQKYLLVLLFLGIISQTKSQDPRFSQYYAAPTRTNPALAGVFDGTTRIFFNYRDQFSSIAGQESFKTIGASYDMRIPVSRYDYFGLSLDFNRDEAGASNFNRIGGNFGGSYIRQLSSARSGAAQYLVGAGQVGFGQWTFEPDRLWFSNQFDPISVAINESLDNGENFDGQNSRLYLSINAGLLWYVLINDKASVYLGGAVYHINEPNIAFTNIISEPLPRRYVAHGGGEMPLSESLSLLPAVIYINQGPASSATLGAQIKYHGRNVSDIDMKVGLWVHASDNVDSSIGIESYILSAMLESDQFSFGVSYDFTNSLLSNINEGRGALEFFVGYKYAGQNGRSYKPTCPSF